MARGCARIDSRLDKAKIGSDGRVEVHRARLLAVFEGRKTFPHGLDPERTSARYRPELLFLGFGQDGQVEREMRSFWIVGNDLQVALKLSHQAGDHLEAQAGARIDVEAVGKANALVGNFNVKMSLHFAGVDLDRASTFW
jgi:hypothetical protein